MLGLYALRLATAKERLDALVPEAAIMPRVYSVTLQDAIEKPVDVHAIACNRERSCIRTSTRLVMACSATVMTDRCQTCSMRKFG